MSSVELNPQIIYEYDNHTNIPWNIVQYDPLKVYHGKSIQPSQAGKYITKKGSFMDQHLKIVKSQQSPDKYPMGSQFDQTQNIKYGHKIKINPKIKKNSYIDQIELQGKKRKIGVGSYNIQKTQRQVKQQIQHMKKYNKTSRAQKKSCFQDYQVTSSFIPGAGNYNPHLFVSHLKKQKMTPQNWRKKHSQLEKQFIKKTKNKPNPFSYRPVSAGTFDRYQIDTERNRKRNCRSMNKSFGTDAKFVYCRPNKKKIMQQRPDPTKYSLQIQWKGKKQDTKKSGWNSYVSTRSNSFSVYL